MKKNILITGGAGFIGSHLVRLFVKKYPDYRIVNLDKLTYAGNLENLSDIEKSPNYVFEKGDIVDSIFIKRLFSKYDFDSVVHLAAESHVDRSIKDPFSFIMTNIFGTVNLLNAVKESWKNNKSNNLFYHVSTDEVYGSLGDKGFFTEENSYNPQSPYSASKASSDHFVRSYGNTYDIPFIISNCSNNYGPNQFPEKLVPLFINNIINNQSLPVYGNGEFTRDWLYVLDHVEAIDTIFHKGKLGDTYNIGGFNEWKNIELIKVLCNKMDVALGNKLGTASKLITYIKDRPGHDKRYAIDATKLKRELDWEPSLQFEEGLVKTIDWYLSNNDWMDNITSGEYKNYYKEQYG